MALDEGITRHESEQLLLFLSLGSLTFRVPMGVAADRFGRKYVIMAILGLYAIFTGKKEKPRS